MLGFVLSKMQMLIFAVGIFLVAILFFNFTSGIQLRNLTSSNLDLQIQTIQGQLITDSHCSYKSISIPEYFEQSLNGSRIYYDLVFSKIDFEGVQRLVLTIKEHGKQNVFDARGVNINGKIVLVDPGFIAADEFIAPYYGKETISLYPRASNTKNSYAPPNAFVSLKEIKDGVQTMYIIPCTTLAKKLSTVDGTIYYLNNCEENILKVGCHRLFLEKNNNPKNTDKISQCFEVEREIVESDYYTSQVSDLTWEDCKKHGYHNGVA
jgi:hypothetical protein